MAANNDVVIERDDNGYKFAFRAVSTFRPKKSQPVVVAPLINVSAANTFLFRFFGPSETVSFSFVLFNDGTDVALGTYTTTVISIAEQAQYLKDVIFTENFDDSWSLYERTSIVYQAGNEIGGVITDLDLDLTSKSTTYVAGSLTFQRGQTGDL